MLPAGLEMGEEARVGGGEGAVGAVGLEEGGRNLGGGGGEGGGKQGLVD